MARKFTLHILSFLFLFFCSQVFAQNGTLRGFIQYKNGETAPGVAIQLVNTNYRAMSDADGYFIIKEIPFGEYTIQVTAIGIESTAFTKTIDKKDEQIEIFVTESEKMLEETIVYGKTEVREVRDKCYAISVIEPKHIELQSIQTNDLLDRTAGVRVRQSGGLGSDVNYNLN